MSSMEQSLQSCTPDAEQEESQTEESTFESPESVQEPPVREKLTYAQLEQRKIDGLMQRNSDCISINMTTFQIMTHGDRNQRFILKKHGQDRSTHNADLETLLEVPPVNPVFRKSKSRKT